MKKTPLFPLIRLAAIAGNVLYILWIVYNAIDSGFSARPMEVMALTGLIVLLILNLLLLIRIGPDKSS